MQPQQVRRLARRPGRRVMGVNYGYEPVVREPDERISDKHEWRVRHIGRGVRLISKVVNGRSIPWVVTAPSVLLHDRGIEGDGLYTARHVKFGDEIGLYTGSVIAYCKDLDIDIDAAKTVKQLVDHGHDKMVIRRRGTHGDCIIIDGQNQSAPYLNLINDPSDPGNPGGGRPETVHLTESGRVRVALELRSYNQRLDWSDNGGSELLMEYGHGFWDTFGAGGENG
jgi:hypothetical protein